MLATVLLVPANSTQTRLKATMQQNYIYRNPTREVLINLPKLPFFYIIEECDSKRYYAGIKHFNPDPGKFMTKGGYRTSCNEIKNKDVANYIIRRIVFIEDRKTLYLHEFRFLKYVDAFNNSKIINGNYGPLNPNTTGCSLKTREKIRLAKLGKPQSESHRKNNSLCRIGIKRKPHTKETIEKMRLAKLGKSHSSETKQKVRLSKQGQLWWNNGSRSCMARECPGIEWIKGRKRIAWT